MENIVINIVFRRPDGTFVALIEGMPYHVTADDPLFEAAQEAGQDAPFEPQEQPPTLAVRRATAEMARADFCKQLVQLKILSPTDAVMAMRGGWPAVFKDAVSNMDAVTQANVEIEWVDARFIRYADTLLQSLALAQTANDPALATKLLDQIFGLEDQ